MSRPARIFAPNFNRKMPCIAPTTLPQRFARRAFFRTWEAVLIRMFMSWQVSRSIKLLSDAEISGLICLGQQIFRGSGSSPVSMK